MRARRRRRRKQPTSDTWHRSFSEMTGGTNKRSPHRFSSIARLTNEARAYADLPQRRRGYVDEIADKYTRLQRESHDNADAVKATFASVLAARDKARGAFPAREADIDKRVQPVQRLVDEATRASQKVDFEAANAGAGRAADFVVLGDNAQLLARNASTIREDARTIDGQLGSLSASYSRALADMKAVYYITVQRWAWNDDADYPSTHTYTYPRQELTGDAFDYFNSLPESLPYAARYRSNWFGSDVQTNSSVAADRWAALGILPKEAWVNRDDTAEYGFTLSADYFHKYLVTENGQTQETDWQKVDETMFESHVDDLGMDIVAKPFGSFEDEKITNPTPAGLAFVGNPQYGRWQTDDRGTSFWAWYGAYRLFGDLLGARGQPVLVPAGRVGHLVDQVPRAAVLRRGQRQTRTLRYGRLRRRVEQPLGVPHPRDAASGGAAQRRRRRRARRHSSIRKVAFTLDRS